MEGVKAKPRPSPKEKEKNASKEMSPKKKNQKSDNSLNSSVKPVLVHDSTSTNSKNHHKLNGHGAGENDSYLEEQDDLPSVVNGCNGNHHASDLSEVSSSSIKVSSPEGSSNQTEQSESIKVLGASLNLLQITEDSLEKIVPLSVQDGGSKSQLCKASSLSPAKLVEKVAYVQYQSELQMPDIMRLIQKDLSEPYSIYTYRYFIHNWPMLCFLVRSFYFLISLMFYKAFVFVFIGYIRRKMCWSYRMQARPSQEGRPKRLHSHVSR